MKALNRIAATLLLALPILANAGYVGLRNFDNHAVSATVNTGFSAVDMRAALIRGGAVHNWVMRDIEPGKLEATLNVRKHQLIMHIDYTPNSYSLKYVSSAELMDSRGRVHDAYLRWCKNLMQATDSQAGAIVMERATMPAASTPPVSNSAQ